MAQQDPKIDQDIEAAIEQSVQKLGLWLDQQFTAEISATKWDYPTPPKVRDIVETGRLRASQTRSVDADGTVTFTWPVEYANQVHEGGVDAKTRRRFPGRPWTKGPLEQADAQFGVFLRSALENLQ